MPVSSETQKVIYTSGTTTFAYSFKIFADADLVVTKVNISTLIETDLTLTTDYTVTGAGDDAGGNVVLNSALDFDTYKLVIRRVLTLTQEIDFTENQANRSTTLESGFDRLTMICQQLQEQIDRAVQVGLTGDSISQEELSAAVQDALDAATAAAADAVTAASAASTATTKAAAADASATAAASSAADAAASAAAAQAVITAMLDTDTALTANSDSKIATQKATKAYTDAVAALGSWASKSASTNYQATTAGFVVGYSNSYSTTSELYFDVYTDSNSNPTTKRQRMQTLWVSGAPGQMMLFCCPVKKNDYYRVDPGAGGATVFFIPFGN